MTSRCTPERMGAPRLSGLEWDWGGEEREAVAKRVCICMSCVCVCACMRACTYILWNWMSLRNGFDMCLCVFLCIWDANKYIQTNMHVFSVRLVHPSGHMYIKICVHIHTQTYTYMLMCVHKAWPPPLTTGQWRRLKFTTVCWPTGMLKALANNPALWGHVAGAAYRTFMPGALAFFCLCSFVAHAHILYMHIHVHGDVCA
jgi:hypothetical protein